MRLAADTSACIGSGQCALAVPEVFDQDEKAGTVEILTERPPAGLDDAVRDAALRCPVGAIVIVD